MPMPGTIPASAIDSPKKQGSMYSAESDDQNIDAGTFLRCGRFANSDAIEVLNAEGQAPVLVLSDHSGRRIPEYLADLGLPPQELCRHIGWDIGATDMTRRIAERLDAPAVLNHISRLVIDPNRDPRTPTSIPEISDGTFVPANQKLDEAERRRRLQLSFIPYHRTISKKIARLRRRVGVPAIVAIHSFTPRMSHQWRPWDVGVLWSEDSRIAAPVLSYLQDIDDLCVGDNQPYTGNHPGSYSVPFHASRNGYPNIIFEVRQDLIDTPEKAERWGDILADALEPVLADPDLYRRFDRPGRLVDGPLDDHEVQALHRYSA